MAEEYTANPSLIFEKIVGFAAAAPRSVSLQRGLATMDYEALDHRSVAVAKHLANLGIGPGGTVAICMERSFEWIVAALGVWRAGAAYVPLDAGWATERLKFAIEDSGASLVIGDAKLLDSLKLQVHGLDPHRDAEIIAKASGEVPLEIEAASLAYVIYTSGSSGVPKGVEITHANVAHLVRWHIEAFDLTSQDRVSHLAGLGFDAAGWELWPALAAGASVHLADEAVRMAPDLLKNWLVQEEITVSFVPTVLATSMIQMEWPETTNLRFLLTGGNALPYAPIAGLPFKVINNYGPSECTVVATSGEVESGLERTPSIGRAIRGTSIYLLNEHGEKVSEGVPGEIYIGGSGVGLGYRNLPEATRNAFVRDPFAFTPGARMFRSGDVGVLLPNGEIDFRGRLDRQVKIRGYRIELDEIGSVLHRHEHVEFATVIVSTSDNGENQLIAYVLPSSGSLVAASELQAHLLGSLPDYMVPATFVRLQQLPVSLNGKVDLGMLERPSPSNLLSISTVRQPSNAIEERLLAMFKELLSSTTVTMEDDFFLVGGHSLIGMQLVLRLRETFGVDFTLRQLFQASTVEKLAAAIEIALIEAVESLSDEEAGMQIAE